MRKAFFWLLILSFLLAACGPSTVPASPGATLPTKVDARPTRFVLGGCADVRLPTPNPNEPSLFAKVTNQDHILGKTDAYVTILVYSDFQCASCAQLAALLKSFVQKYPADVRVVFRNFPLESMHDKAALAARAAEAAGMQNKFWEMHDLLFSKQAEWLAFTPAQFTDWLSVQGSGLGLDPARMQTDLSSPAITSLVDDAWKNGQKIGLPGAPMILINGEIMKWQVNLLDQLEGFVLLARLRKQQFNSCPTQVIDPSRQYTARLFTTRGEILIRLFADKAPNTVNNFVFLAKNGWFDNVPLHQVVPGQFIQTGDPSGTGMGNPGYFLRDEISPALVYNKAGMIGMANTGQDANGSQFFITLAATPQFNGKNTIFGEVIHGMDLLVGLPARDPSLNTASSGAERILSITIEEK